MHIPGHKSELHKSLNIKILLFNYLARIIHESQTRPWDSLQNVL